MYLTDGRMTINNGPAEQAIRPLAVVRRTKRGTAIWTVRSSGGGLRQLTSGPADRAPDWARG